ncbi:MAG: signal recognition particle-docking protein FtsY [Candidatus Aenigmarchaeota archaeon]|nr:signal recognition particle-docking protein FtsY [Candidatus Aenigmarchaeota archaeon]
MFGLFKKKISAAVEAVSEKIAGGSEKKEIKPEKSPLKEKPVEPVLKKEDTTTNDAPKAEEPKKEEPEKKGILSKITGTFTEKTLSTDFLKDVLWDLELALLENNVAQNVSETIITDIKKSLSGKSVRKKEVREIIQNTLKSNILGVLDLPKIDIEAKIREKQGEPLVIALIGFNGAGKTTTSAKLAHYFMKNKHSCVFAAADSFRVAAIEQLEEHAKNLSVKIIKHNYGADPAAVIFDAVAHAKAKHIDIVIADTAGRVHTDKNLLSELEKIVRVNKPDLKFLVVEAVSGNDVVEQARVFDSVGIDGVVLTKWDVDEKGGAALSLCHTLKKPIVFLGTGQEYDDFVEFDAKEVLKSVF